MTRVHVANLETAPVRTLNPEARGTHRLLMQGAEGLGSIDMIRFDLRTRQQGAYHLHERTDNVMLVLSGTLEMVVDGKRHILRENDMIYIPRGITTRSPRSLRTCSQGCRTVRTWSASPIPSATRSGIA